MSNYEQILYRVEDRVANITMNRPEKRNALSYQMRGEMVDAMHRAERDDDVSVVLIDGAGPSFCAGYDITPDGQRFLMVQPTDPEQPATQINVVLNWFDELKKKVPTGK